MKVSRIIYAIFSSLFVIGVLVQVFFAGMTVVARQWPWTNHIGLGHMLALPLLIMLVSMYFGKLPRRMKLVSWLLLGVYVLQADILIFMRTSVPIASALHPVLALVDFAMGVWLAWQAIELVRYPAEPATEETQLSTV